MNSSAQSMTFTDTDIAQGSIVLNGGTGIDIGANNTIAIETSVARNNNGYVIDGNGSVLYANGTYTGGDGININTSNAIKVDSSVARENNSFVTNFSGSRLLSAGTQGRLKIYQDGTQKCDFNGNQSVDVVLSSPTVQTPSLQEVLNTGFQAIQNSRNTGTIQLTGAGNEVTLYGDGGAIELTRTDGPYIDLKTNTGADYNQRISGSGGNLVLESKTGGVFVANNRGEVFEITPNTGGGGGGSAPTDPYFAGNGINISGARFISVDEAVVATREWVEQRAREIAFEVLSGYQS